MQLSDKIREVKLDRTSGASQLTRKALNVFKLFAQNSKSKTNEEFTRDFGKLAEKLLKTKPAMASIQNFVAQIVYEIEASKKYDIASVQKFAL